MAAFGTWVAIDVNVCLNAPRILWLSGVGDLVSKFSAVFDWKLAFHHRGELVEDLAALLSDASVYQFLANPAFTPQGLTQLGTALMLTKHGNLWLIPPGQWQRASYFPCPG